MKTLPILKKIIPFLLYLSLSITVSGQTESTRAEIFNFEIGDIFHTYYYHHWGESYETEKYSTISILDKFYSQTGDTLFYEEEIHCELVIWWDSTYYSDSIDTLIIDELDSLVLNGQADSVYSDPELYNGRQITSYIYASPDFENGGYINYVTGCGGPYFWEHTDFYGDLSGNYLVYFKKGDEEWGTPYFVSIPEKNSRYKQIKLYPNPASVSFIIGRMDQKLLDLQVSIYSSDGSCIKTLSLKSGENQVNISDLPEGFFIVKISNGSEIFYSKLIKN